MANREMKTNRETKAKTKREVGRMLSRETKSMLKNVTSIVMSALLATTVFFSGLGAYNPEPVHAAGGGVNCYSYSRHRRLYHCN